MTFVSYDTLLGAGLGLVAVYALWNKLDDWSEPTLKPRSDRKFDEEDLAIYDGKGTKLCYVAIGNEVFDLTKDKEMFSSKYGGKKLANFPPCLPEEKFRKRYFKVGDLLVMRNFTKAELSEFDGRDGKPVYICAKGTVYEVDKNFYGPDGPYGMMAGKDASRALALVSLDPADIENSNIDDLGWSDLNSLDEWVAKFDMKYQKMGHLVDKKKATAIVRESSTTALSKFLTKNRQQVSLSEKIEISHDTRIFRFALPDSKSILGLPIGKHIKIWCPNPDPVKEGEWNGRPDNEAGKKEIERKYTPSSLDMERVGFFDIVIKVYKGGVIERFPDGGKMSQWLDKLNIGDKMDVAGPFGLIEYKGNGTLSIKRKDHQFNQIGMICGGTGITPALQLIKSIMNDPNDKTKLSLIFANQTEEDILVRDMLEDQAEKNPDRFKLHYTLDRPPENWKYSKGFINEEMIKANMPPAADDTIILMCGPPPMINFAVKPNLDKLGYSKDQQVEF